MQKIKYLGQAASQEIANFISNTKNGIITYSNNQEYYQILEGVKINPEADIDSIPKDDYPDIESLLVEDANSITIMFTAISPVEAPFLIGVQSSLNSSNMSDTSMDSRFFTDFRGLKVKYSELSTYAPYERTRGRVDEVKWLSLDEFKEENVKLSFSNITLDAQGYAHTESTYTIVVVSLQKEESYTYTAFVPSPQSMEVYSQIIQQLPKSWISEQRTIQVSAEDSTTISLSGDYNTPNTYIIYVSDEYGDIKSNDTIQLSPDATISQTIQAPCMIKVPTRRIYKLSAVPSSYSRYLTYIKLTPILQFNTATINARAYTMLSGNSEGVYTDKFVPSAIQPAIWHIQVIDKNGTPVNPPLTIMRNNEDLVTVPNNPGIYLKTEGGASYTAKVNMGSTEGPFYFDNNQVIGLDKVLLSNIMELKGVTYLEG